MRALQAFTRLPLSMTAPRRGQAPSHLADEGRDSAIVTSYGASQLNSGWSAARRFGDCQGPPIGLDLLLLILSSRTGFTGVTGTGIPALIFFIAITVGTATVSISNIQLLDSNLDSIFPDSPLSATLNNTVNITGNDTAIPEPSTFVLLLRRCDSLESLTRSRR